MLFADYYEVLGVESAATAQVVQEAYSALCARPLKDVTDFTRRYFADLAYAVLGNDFARANEDAALLWPRTWRSAPSVNLAYVEWYECPEHSPFPDIRMAASRKSMLKALRTAVLADSVVDRANEQILLSLVARDLCDGDGRLTEWGQVNGISACTLEQQCELLGIPMSTLPSSAGKPEDMAMDHFVGAGARPVYDEGAMAWQLLFCLALRATLELGTDHWLTGYRQPENLQDEDQIRYSALSWPFGPDFLRTAPNALVVWRECILTTPLDQLVDNAETLKQWMYQETAWGRVYGNSHLARIHATADLLRFRELLGCRLAALTDFYFAEGRGSGWPDLVVMEPGDLRMVEVKKSDKLLASQIIALPRLRDEVGLDVSVLRFRG